MSLAVFGNTQGATRDFVCKEEYNENIFLDEETRNQLDSRDIYLCFCGALNFTVLNIAQDQKRSNDDDTVFSSQGDINFRCLFRGSGYGYGAEIGVKTNSGVVKRGSTVLRSSFLFFEADKIGTLKLGYTNTAADSFGICGDKFLAGYLGPGSGNLGFFYNASAGSEVSTGFPRNDGKAAKLVWISPTVSGFSTGLSFTPDSRNVGLLKNNRNRQKQFPEKADFSGMKTAYSQNIITGGFAYERGTPNGPSVKISIATWFGNGKSGNNDDSEVHNVRAYNIGLALGYGALKISMGYTDSGKSLLAKKYASQEIAGFDISQIYRLEDPNIGLRPGANAGKIYSAGIAYSWKDLTVSAGYFTSAVKFSEKEKSTADVITMAAIYECNNRMQIYVEYDHIVTDAGPIARAYGAACGLSSTGKNSANVIMIGSKISF